MDLGASSRRVAAGVMAMSGCLLLSSAAIATAQTPTSQRPNIVMLMTDDTGWNEFGAYSGGGVALGHPTPNVDRMATEGASSRVGMDRQAVPPDARRSSRGEFRSARRCRSSSLPATKLPSQRNSNHRRVLPEERLLDVFLRQVAPGRQAGVLPTAHGFDEMKQFAAYYAGVYAYSDTSKWFHPWFPSFNPEFKKGMTYREPGRVGRRGRTAGENGRHHHLRFAGDLRHSPGRQRGRLHQAAREGRQAVLHGRELHQDAQPDQRRAGVPRQVAPG